MSYSHAGFYVLRSPYGSITHIIDSYNSYTTIDAFERLLVQLLHRPAFRKALYIASPAFYYECSKFIEQPDSFSQKEKDKLLNAVFRYWVRMGTRCTPFGMFAGVAAGTINEYTAISLKEADKNPARIRLDMSLLSSLTALLSEKETIRNKIKYFSNNSAYVIGNDLYYIEYIPQQELRKYQLSSVTRSVQLDAILSQAKNGGTIDDLASVIALGDISITDARCFINELIENQLLISELEPNITGEAPLKRLIEKLVTFEEHGEILEKLQAIDQLLKEPHPAISELERGVALAGSLVPSYKGKSIIQVDLQLSHDSNSLDEKVVASIKDQVLALWRIADFHPDNDLEQFKRAFSGKYELREIPLSHAFDPDYGVGYGAYTSAGMNSSTLTNGLFAATLPQASGPSKLSYLREQKYLECMARNDRKIVITREDLLSIPEEAPLIPDSFYIQGQLFAEQSDPQARNYQFLLQKCSGPSGLNNITRFCQGDEALTYSAQHFIQQEESLHDDVLYAEVVHLPQTRNGNILQRPALRNFEIVYLGNGGADESHQLHLDDLLVSVINDTVCLRSRKFGKRVIPRLTTAHNFTTRNLPVYKFLCDLQFQHVYKEISWQWGPLRNNIFLPAVRFENIILQRATWNIAIKSHEELSGLIKGKVKNNESWIAALISIRKKLSLPRYVAITSDDNDLFLDLEHHWCLKQMAQQLRKDGVIKISDCEGYHEKCIVNSPAGKHAGEIVIPVIRAASSPQVLRHRLPVGEEQKSIKRRFIPGEEWSYFKLYCGVKVADNILREVITPLCKGLMRERIIEKWFYIRFADPDHHLRVRFYHQKDPAILGKIQAQLEACARYYLDHDLIYKVQADTYNREIERYGAGFMELSEDIFFRDSEAALHILHQPDAAAREHKRWLIAARSIDMLLSDFAFTLSAKQELLSFISKQYYAEFGESKHLMRQLDEKYRLHRKALAAYLNDQEDGDNDLTAIVSILRQRSSFIRPIYNSMQRSARYTEWSRQLLSSYIHMSFFRILTTNFRKNELVLYHLLARHYNSRIAQEKYNKQDEISHISTAG